MALNWAPFSPWHWWATLAGIGLVLMAVLAVLRNRSVGWSYRPLPRKVIFVATLASAICLVLATWNPQLVKPKQGQPFQLAVVLDVSPSVRGGPGGWQEGRDKVESLAAAWLRAMPDSIRDSGTAAIFTLQDQATLTVPRHPLKALPTRLRGLDETRFASGKQSHLAAGLNRVAQWMVPSQGQGVCILVTDGHQTRGKLREAAEKLVRRGIPVHIIAAKGAGPDLDWTAADLPDQVGTTAPTYLRAVLRNGLQKKAKASLQLTMNGGVEAEQESAKAETRQMTIEAGGWRRLRWPLKFRGTGIQYADLTLQDGRPQPRTRRFFSYIQQPPRILVVGGDFRLADTLPRDQVQVDLVAPENTLTAMQANHYDGVVLAGVNARDLGDDALAQIAWSVEKEGMGLFVANGDHAGLGVETETILMSYNDTVLEDLLPLSSRPRPYTPEAPGRQVVVVLDASGSMGGWRIRKSQEIVAYIIESHLRPRDRLYLLTFSTGARILVENRYMDQQGKTDALAALYGIKTGGGTDPSLALDLLGRRRLRNCGLIFLSDGEFDQVSYRPDCRATVFALGSKTVAEYSPLRDIADPFPVTQGFSPEAIEMPYFEQKTRNRFFENGTFTPMGMDLFLARSERQPIPDLPLEGSAVTFAKDEASLIAVRPKLTDPVLAYAERGMGEVGVFTSSPSRSWLRAAAGREAMSSWILRTLGFTARDRYRFRVVDLGNALEIEVALIVRDGKLPAISQLQGEIVIPGVTPPDITFTPDPQTPGTFRGRLRLQQIEAPIRAKLILREAGPEAVSRTQAVPLFLPPAGEPQADVVAERYSSGTNRTLLADVAELTGGEFEPKRDTLIFPQTPDREPPVFLWPWFVVLAVLFHLLAIGFQRLAD